MKKTKVYIDVFYYKTALSGIKTYIEELVKGFNKYGRKDIEYIFSHDIEKLKNKQFFINSKYRLVRWVFQLRYLVWKQIILPIKLLSNSADILICPDYVAPIFSTTRKIVVIHDNLFWKYPFYYPVLWRNYFVILIKLGVSKNCEIVTTSKYSKKKLINIFPNSKNINFIYQSFNFHKTTSYNYKTPENYLLHIGSFEKRKDLITLVKAFKLVDDPNLKLVLAGAQIINGNSQVLVEIKTFIDQNKLENKVILTGFVSKEEVAVLYKNASIYVFPSLDEGFGIPVLEALSFSIPVICSDIDVFREIGGNYVEYFKVGDSISLYKKITSILKSVNSKQKNNLTHLNKFSRKNFIKGFEEIILENND